MKCKTHFIGVALACLPFGISAATGIGDVQWHGFMTAAANITDSSVDYAGSAGDDVGFRDSRFGLNVSARIAENWAIAGQLLGKNFEDEDYKLEVDWALATYNPTDRTALRFGRIKYPAGLLTEFVETGYTYLWIRPPESIYNLEAHGPNTLRKAFDGVNGTWQIPADSVDYSVDVYGGTAEVDDGHMKNFLGIKFEADMEDVLRFQVSVNNGTMEVDNSHGRQAMMDGASHTTYTLGLSVDWNNVLLQSEVAMVRMGKSNSTLFTSAQRKAIADSMDATNWYSMLGYRLGKATPHVTYSKWDQDSGVGQETLTVGVRYEVAPSIALKAEWNRIIDASAISSGSLSFLPAGNAGLFAGDPDGNVNLYAAALEFIF